LTSTGIWNVEILLQATMTSTSGTTPSGMFITTNSATTYSISAAEALTDFKETASSFPVHTDARFWFRLTTTLTITESNLTWNIYIGKFNNSNVTSPSLYLNATRIG
jgi:hypothetical protein